MNRNARVALVGAFIVVAVAAFLIARSGSDNDTGGSTVATSTTAAPTGAGTATTARPKPAPAPPQIVVRNGKPVGGIKKIKVKVGQRVAFSVTSDVADEVHVHGYDIHKDVKAGGTASFSFKATSDGVYVVELERRAEQIAELRVNP